MTNRFTKYILFFSLCFGLKTYAQQGVQFSQYAFTGLTVNPAYAGYKEDWTLNLVSRLQWTGIPGAPRTGAVSVDGVTNPDSKNIGIGVVFVADQLGPQTTSSVYANYSYRIRLDDEDSQRLSFGLGIGATQYSVDYNKFTATDAFDPSIGTGTITKLTPDFRFGVYYASNTFYAGLSALNLLAGNGFFNYPAVIREERTYYLTAGGMVPISDNLQWKPSVLFKEDFKGPTNVDLSSNFLIGNVIWAGAAYRSAVPIFKKSDLASNLQTQDAIIGMVQVYVNPRFRIGYSYDYGVNGLANSQNGTHELSLGLTFGRRSERVLNPRFF